VPPFVSDVHLELDRLMRTFGPRFIIGLSGGGDSMALAHVAANWAQQSQGVVSALIIDHGLRAGSAEEAKSVQSWALGMGLRADIHTYEGPRFTARVQERARSMRHAAFEIAAREAGGATLLLGHTVDDQAETIAFRLSRQTGLDGLAGMARVTTELLPGVPIARPLLGISRQALRDYLRDAGQVWIEDPSNTNLAFSRVRVRARLAQIGGIEKLVAIGEHARIIKHALDQAALALIKRCDFTKSAKGWHFSAAGFVVAEGVVQRAMLAQILQNHHPIQPQKLDRLAAQMVAPDFKSATLVGKMIRRRMDLFWVTPAPPRKNQSAKTSPLTNLGTH
jgi:tRNA(Ile)-lysidine synthase